MVIMGNRYYKGNKMGKELSVAKEKLRDALTELETVKIELSNAQKSLSSVTTLYEGFKKSYEDAEASRVSTLGELCVLTNKLLKEELIPCKKAMRFFLVNEETLMYGFGSDKNCFGEENIGFREIDIKQAYQFNDELKAAYIRERGKANNYRNLLLEGKLILTSDALMFINKTKKLIYKIRHLCKHKQSLQDYAIEKNEHINISI